MASEDKNTLHDNAIGWFILGCVFFALFLLFWHFFQYDIKNAFRWYRWYQMWLESFFIDEDFSIIWKEKTFWFGEALDEIPLIPQTKLNGNNLGPMSLLAMMPLRMPIALCLGFMGVWCLMWGPGTQFRRKMGLDGLIHAQARTFPVIQPFIKFNPANKPPRPPGAKVPQKLPIFAEALGPEEWLTHNQAVPGDKVDEEAAFVAFAQQLGGRWEGPFKLAPHRQILLAAFCLKAVRKRVESDMLLGRIARCWSEEGGLQLGKDGKLLGDARRILKDRDISEQTLSRCNQHGFETTALLRALATAREEGGVLAPAQFVWLRAHDRRLWYPLNNLGRQSFHMEALGAMAHYKAERLTRRPIPKPKVKNAVDTIVTYMKSPRARKIPKLDLGKGQKGAQQAKARR